MEWLRQPCLQPNQAMINKALEHQAQLTKPPGALGVLEQIAVRLAGLQNREHPKIEQVHISVFAADHGVAAEGVSAFPQEVTAQMVSNFLQGGAAINVLARETGAHLEIIDVGTCTPLPANDNLIVQRAGPGTANSAQQAAMTHEQLEAALQAGHAAVERALTAQADLFIGGEMGIANTTAATALYCALLDQKPEHMTGAGTGLDKAGIIHKAQVIRRILALHQAECAMDLPSSPLDGLRCVGGFEIAALTAAIVRAAQTGIPFLVDGFIVSAAALVACRINPAVRDWLIFSHQSAEQGHAAVLTVFEANRPLLDLGLRLGEGSGAAVAIPLLRLACSLHNQMATFAEATVTGKIQ